MSHSSCHTVLRVLANIIASIILSNWHYLEKIPTLLTQIVPEFIPNPTHIRKILKDSPSTSPQSTQLFLIWVVDTVVASLMNYVGESFRIVLTCLKRHFRVTMIRKVKQQWTQYFVMILGIILGVQWRV